MGRSIPSIRMELQAMSERWRRAARPLREGDRAVALRLAEMVKSHSSEAFFAFDDPLEAAVFSILVEHMREGEDGVDP